MIGIGHENDRFAQALRDEVLRRRLMAEYARKSTACGWAAVLQVCIATVLFLLPGTQNAHYVFLAVGLGFLILCLRLRRDLKLLKRADQRQAAQSPAA
jgi:hypothetical protein